MASRIQGITVEIGGDTSTKGKSKQRKIPLSDEWDDFYAFFCDEDSSNNCMR